MSVLSDVSIHAQLTSGRLRVDPLAAGAVQPSSVDLRLGPCLLLATPDGWREHSLIDNGPYPLAAHAFVLGATIERVEIPDDLVGVLVGKSSRAREGIQVEAAGYVDPGWRGHLTLEIVGFWPGVRRLAVGMPIAQLRLHRLTTPAERPYGSDGLGSHYQESTGPTPSRLHLAIGGTS